MPFDKISPQLLLVMRVLTGTLFLALGGAQAYLGGSSALSSAGALLSRAAWALPASAAVYGVFLASAGLMLLELITRPPFKVAINVPFVAANFQVALAMGLVALGPALFGSPLIASEAAPTLKVLCVVGVVMNFGFVLMTKLHWNFTENTGKELPKG